MSHDRVQNWWKEAGKCLCDLPGMHSKYSWFLGYLITTYEEQFQKMLQSMAVNRFYVQPIKPGNHK